MNHQSVNRLLSSCACLARHNNVALSLHFGSTIYVEVGLLDSAATVIITISMINLGRRRRGGNDVRVHCSMVKFEHVDYTAHRASLGHELTFQCSLQL